MRKLLLTALVAGPLATLPAPLWALPDTSSANLPSSTGVTNIQVNGSTLNISALDKAVLNWTEFGSGTNLISGSDTINYFLPETKSSLLNNVTGSAATTIAGKILSNGNIYVLNPNGILVGAGADIQVGGFYASTVPEPSSFFAVNGSLSFNGSASKNVVVSGNPSIQAAGPGNNIFLVGNAVDVQSGRFFGNLTIRATSIGNVSGLAAGNSTFVSLASGGNVTVSLLGNPQTIGGGLTITSNGGDVNLTGGNTLAIAPSPLTSSTGAVSVNTTGTVLNGSITQTGGGSFVAATTGTVVTMNAGTGTTAGNITLSSVNFLTVGLTGNNVSISDSAGGITLNAVTTASNFTVNTTGGGVFQGTGTHSIGGNATLGVASGQTLNFTATGNLTIGSAISTSTVAITTSGDLKTAGITASTSLALTSTGGQISTGAITSASTLNVTATSSAGKLTAVALAGATSTINVANDISITTLNVISGGTLGITSTAGNIGVGSIAATASSLSLTASTGTVTVGTISIGSTATISAGTVSLGNVTATGVLTSTATTGTLTTGTIGTTAALNLSSTLGSLTTGNITTSTVVTLTAPATSGTITTGTITNSATNRLVSLSSGGNISLSTTTSSLLSLTSTAGSITQTGAIISNSTATLNAAADIQLANTNNNFGTVILLGGAFASGAGVNLADSDGLIIGGTTNTKAPTTIAIAAGNISLGTTAVETLTFGSTLSLTTGSAGLINTNANTISVFGNVTLNAGTGGVTLGNNALGNVAAYTFGQVSGNVTGTISIFENTTLNLGNLTGGSTLDARSGNGDIVNTGKVSIVGNATFAAGTIFSQNNITLANTQNQLANVIIGNAKDFTLVNAVGNTVVTAGSINVNGKAATGVVSVTTLEANKTLTLKTDSATGGDFNTVGFNSAGSVTLTDPNGLTLQNVGGSGTGTISVTANGPIVLGSGIAIGNVSTTITSLYTSGGPMAGITDSSPGIRIVGDTTFVSDGNIDISQAGHSFGIVNLKTTGFAAGNTTLAGGNSSLTSIRYTEGGTVNLGNVSVGTASYPGNLSITSTGGNIQQASGASTITGFNASATTPTAISFTAAGAGGTVNLSNGVNSIAFSPISITAIGNSAIASTTNLFLGNVVVTAGTFSADVSGTAAATISQGTGSSIKAYGASSFKSQGGKITLSNSGNNFGGLTLTSNTGAAAGADVAISESGVLNFVTVNTGTAGKLTALSENASIIQTAGNITVGGITTLTAATGITLVTSTNNFGGSALVLSTPGNVSITDGNISTVLGGGTNIVGTLSLRNTHTTTPTSGINDGSIRDTLGNISVGGSVLLDTGSTAGTSILFNSANSTFGAVTFRSGDVNITESSTFNLGANSFAAGNVSLTSSLGSIITSGAGSSNFQKTLTLNASGAAGNITISNPIFVNGVGTVGLTFRAIGAVDLSLLSLSLNLNNIAPTNLGASSYKTPQP